VTLLSSKPAPSDPPYRDSGLPVETRAADLLARMTRREKLAQLVSVWAADVLRGPGVDETRARVHLEHGVGQITRLAGASNLEPSEVARAGNAIQRFLVEETRLGIPAILHEETLHGLMARSAPCFQQSIGAAASWDPDLIEAVAHSIGRRMRALGLRQGLAPVLDLARDPRWGRIEETYGEDPFLATAMGCAFVRGLQGAVGRDLSDGVVATGKHMVGHGAPEGGLNQAPAHLGPREVREEFLLPFEAAIREAGMASVMHAYTDLDGIPCVASEELLTAILRDEWGFDGVVLGDFEGIQQLVTQHRMTSDLGLAAELALQAGVDVETPAPAAYAEPLARRLEAGAVPERLVDRAVARTLSMKFRLGLFDQPYVDEKAAAAFHRPTDEERRLGRELAGRSLVLVKNAGVLPLRVDVDSIAVIGPLAQSSRELLGDYSYVAALEALLDNADDPGARPGIQQGARILDQELAQRLTIVDVLRERLGKARVAYEPGCGLTDGTDAQIQKAVGLARGARVAILVLGERSGMSMGCTTGESRDRLEIGLPGRQQELLESVVATGTPVVLVVLSGRPLALEWAAKSCDAILLAWVPGDEGPGAIVDTLFGDRNPGGKIPFSVPRHVGQVPLSYRGRPSGGMSHWHGNYVDGPVGPLWPFGFGLSYTSFDLSNLRLDPVSIPTAAGETCILVDVRNVGDRPGDEVLQLYIRDEEASVTRPIRELRGFRRLTLGPGETCTVTFSLASEQLGLVDRAMRHVIEPGLVRIWVGTSSADQRLTADLQLVGPIVEVRERARYLTPTRVQPRPSDMDSVTSS
jgi:beta-glucosidase